MPSNAHTGRRESITTIGERTPSLHVRPSLQGFHCFGCGAGGDAFDFIQAADGVSRVESVELLANRVGLVIDYEDRDQ
ncbi:hypothetical protein CH251_02410 [Rhodococcus sp. 06-462-5]|nr:hypothetical protein CH251_02410 [Rhodococcus sp. 06-462-5]OZE63681.1 hypothetical protein CH270_17160 [Rhodococcus sp. 02-925g]